MADDVIVLLSSDDSDPPSSPGVFCDGPSKRRKNGPPQNPTTASETSTRAKPVAVSAVAATPATKRPRRVGFFEPYSDEVSSPVPSVSQEPFQTKPAPKRTLAEANNRKEDDREVVLLSDASGEHDNRRVAKDNADDEERLPKRPRLHVGSGTTTAAAAVAPISMADFDSDFPGRSSPSALRFDSSSPVRRQIRTPPLPAIPAEKELPSLPRPREPGALPHGTAECIDLLDSSGSEVEDTTLPRARVAPNNTCRNDFDSLFMTQLPRPEDRAVAREPTEVVRKEKSVEILVLSSSSPPPARPTSSSHHIQRTASDRTWGAKTSTQRMAPRGNPKPTQHRSLQRSFSEGHRLGFMDDEDDDIGRTADFTTVDNLLAAWRGGQDPQKKNREEAFRDGSPVSRRTSSGAERTTATTTTRKSTGVDDAADSRDKETRRKEKEAEREQKRKEKEAEKEKKQKDREVERERRRIAAELAKEKKAEERAAAAAFHDANKSRTDKSVATPEMIVRLPNTLPQATREVLEPMLAEIKVDFEPWTSPGAEDGAVVVTWRRKVTSEYREELGHWEPVPLRVEDEPHVLVFLRGEELVRLIVAQDPAGQRRIDDLGGHVRTMQRHFPNHSIVYLIEGLTAWRAKNRSTRNRQFAEAVRGEDAGSRARQSRRSAAAVHVDETVVEDGLMALQMEHEVLVQESTQALDTARWIRSFTEQIATGRYRRLKEQEYAAAASFCMDAGQIATGDGGTETYVRMLQQIGRVTEPVALGVAARFGSVSKLVAGLEDEGPLALEACLKSRNRNGELSDRTVGPALSRRIYKVFMGEDETSQDI